jgi:hypothetical protein
MMDQNQDQDPRGPKTYGSYGSGSTTLYLVLLISLTSVTPKIKICDYNIIYFQICSVALLCNRHEID